MSQEFDLLWSVLHFNRCSRKLLTHDIRGIIGRGLLWGTLAQNQAKNVDLDKNLELKDCLSSLEKMKASEQATLDEVDHFNTECVDDTKVGWCIGPRPKKIAYSGQYILFEGVDLAQALAAKYLPDVIVTTADLAAEPAVQTLLAKAKSRDVPVKIIAGTVSSSNDIWGQLPY